MNQGDFVQTIEAAYAVDRSPHEWLSGVLDSARSWFDQGSGMWAYAWEIGEDGAVVFTDHVARGGPRALDLRDVSVQPPEIRRMGAEALRSNACGLSSRVLKRREIREFFLAPLRAAGIADALGINGIENARAGVWIGAYLARSRPLARGEERLYRRLARHLAAGNRLRKRLGGRNPTDADAAAILSPDARVEHAARSATSAAARAALREAVLAIDRARGSQRRSDPVGAVRCWRVLADSRFTLVDRFESDGRRYVVACDNPIAPGADTHLTARERQVVALYRLGAHSKLIAYELGLADATVRVLLSRAARRLGAASPRALRSSSSHGLS